MDGDLDAADHSGQDHLPTDGLREPRQRAGIEPQVRQRDVVNPSSNDPVDPPKCRRQEARLAADMDLDLGEIFCRLVADRELRGDRDGILMECGTDPLGQRDLYVDRCM